MCKAPGQEAHHPAVRAGVGRLSPQCRLAATAGMLKAQVIPSSPSACLNLLSAAGHVIGVATGPTSSLAFSQKEVAGFPRQGDPLLSGHSHEPAQAFHHPFLIEALSALPPLSAPGFRRT
jgi:hypothetical protein